MEELKPSYESPNIADCKYVASYTWMDRATPTIMVPGKSPFKFIENESRYFGIP